MKSDIEIARSCKMKRIEEVAATIGIPADELEHYGKYMAKVPLTLIDEERVAKNRLILVSSISPTRAGIGKTTVSIGLSMALNRMGETFCIGFARAEFRSLFRNERWCCRWWIRPSGTDGEDKSALHRRLSCHNKRTQHDCSTIG